MLLKRGLAATIDEFVRSAEYIVSRGNMHVMLIERGIRTYEKATKHPGHLGGTDSETGNASSGAGGRDAFHGP